MHKNKQKHNKLLKRDFKSNNIQFSANMNKTVCFFALKIHSFVLLFWFSPFIALFCKESREIFL